MSKTTKDNMELDDLKKSWNALDKQLQKENIIDEKQVSELITKYQAGAAKGIKSLNGLQRFSVGVGVVAVALIVVVLVVVPSLISDIMTQLKTIVMAVFVGLTLILGMLWDLKTYRWSRDTRVDEMPVVTVIERMNTFRRWVKYEMIAFILWTVVFLGLYYWVMEYYKQPLISQVVFIVLVAVFVCLLGYILYKKVIYKYLDDIKKNLEELKEIETDNK